MNYWLLNYPFIEDWPLYFNKNIPIDYLRYFYLLLNYFRPFYWHSYLSFIHNWFFNSFCNNFLVVNRLFNYIFNYILMINRLLHKYISFSYLVNIDRFFHCFFYRINHWFLYLSNILDGNLNFLVNYHLFFSHFFHVDIHWSFEGNFNLSFINHFVLYWPFHNFVIVYWIIDESLDYILIYFRHFMVNSLLNLIFNNHFSFHLLINLNINWPFYRYFNYPF